MDEKAEKTSSRLLVHSKNSDHKGPLISNVPLLVTGRAILASLFISSLPAVNATFSIARCCTLAARENFHTYWEEFYPWEACNFNVEIDYSSSVTYPSITRPMSWVKQHCRGAQYNSLNQWLQPLATYISPYIGMLLITPIGDLPEDSFKTWGPSFGPVVKKVWTVVQEYMNILGDPASAMFGAFSEIWSDARAISQLSRPGANNLTTLKEKALWVTALAGDIRFERSTSWHDGVVQAIEGSEKPLAQQTETNNSDGHDEKAKQHQDEISPIKTDKRPTTSASALLAESRVSQELADAIGMVIVARPGFISGILIPVILMLAVTAATFLDAYSNVGDKDTSLALAYCVWYSWLLILGVAANCFASTINTDLAQRAFGNWVNFGYHPISVSLRDRYVNGKLWEDWAESPDRPGGYAARLECVKSSWRSWALFSAGQLLGWSCVAFPSACAVAIAWTTPTVGLGCRSFNFILYIIFAFVNACLHVLCSWLSIRSQIRMELQEQSAPGSKWDGIVLKVIRGIYWFFVFVNSLVVVLGTIFHLVGVFRTCWCERLTWDDSTLVELNSKTAQAVDNARRYWLSTSYVDFGVIWLVCLVAITFRRYIVQKMDDWVEREN